MFILERNLIFVQSLSTTLHQIDFLSVGMPVRRKFSTLNYYFNQMQDTSSAAL